MKFSSLQENLKQGMFIVGHVAGKNPSLPILNNILIEANEGNIKLTSTNLEIGISCLIRGRIEEEGKVTVDAKIISDYINLLPNKKVNLEVKDNSVVIDCENYKTKIKGQSSEDFPLIPGIEKEFVFKIDVLEFKKAISQVAFAAALSEGRIELSGVLFVFSDKNLTLVATDSYRLAEKKISIKNLSEKNENEEKKVIVPVKTIQEVFRILNGSKDEVGVESSEVEVCVSENQISFTYGGTEIVSRLIEGQYPDYQQIIPTVSKTNAFIEVKQLVRAVKASALFSKTGINDVNLDFPQGKNQLIVSSASGLAGENVTEIEVNSDGDDNGVVVNYRYLLDGLNNVNDEVVKFNIVDGNTPCLMRPENDQSFLYIIMPIKQ